MSKTKSTWGGPRKPGSGKTIGRPTLYGEVMEYQDIRMPVAWKEKIKAAGNGNYSEGVRKLVAQALGVSTD